MIETVAPGLHDAILLGAGVSAVYLVVALMQLAQLKRHKPATLREMEPSLGIEHLLSKERLGKKEEVSSETSFALHLRRSNVEADIQRLNTDVQTLRNVLSATQEEITSLRAQNSENAKSAQRNQTAAVPQYNDAVALAKRGLNAAGIAARCGISMGEADLVVALARSAQDSSLVAEAKQTANKEQNERHHVHGQRAAA